MRGCQNCTASACTCGSRPNGSSSVLPFKPMKTNNGATISAAQIEIQVACAARR
jgi:hypothetical protein